MTEAELRKKIVRDFRELVNDIANIQTIESSDNPFKKVSLSTEFLNAKLTAPVLTDDELKTILTNIDKSIEEEKQIKDILKLVGQGLKIAAKFLI